MSKYETQNAARGGGEFREHGEPERRQFATIPGSSAGSQELPPNGTPDSILTAWHAESLTTQLHSLYTGCQFSVGGPPKRLRLSTSLVSSPSGKVSSCLPEFS